MVMVLVPPRFLSGWCGICRGGMINACGDGGDMFRSYRAGGKRAFPGKSLPGHRDLMGGEMKPLPPHDNDSYLTALLRPDSFPGRAGHNRIRRCSPAGCPSDRRQGRCCRACSGRGRQRIAGMPGGRGGHNGMSEVTVSLPTIA